MSEYGEGWREQDGDVLPPENTDSTIAYPVPDNSEYMVGAIAAGRRLLSVEPIQPEKTGSKKLDPAERLTMIHERFAFYPLSQRELSDAVDITGKDLPGGAATQLNIILKRQAAYMDDPAATVRSIIGRYYTYAQDAVTEAGLLGTLNDSLDNVPARMNIAGLSSVAIWREEPSVWRPLMAILQDRDIQEYTKDDLRDTPLEPDSDKKPRLYTIGNAATAKQLEKMIASMKVGELKELISQATSRHASRFDFWVQALEQSRNHAAARNTAYSALVKLRVISGE